MLNTRASAARVGLVAEGRHGLWIGVDPLSFRMILGRTRLWMRPRRSRFMIQWIRVFVMISRRLSAKVYCRITLGGALGDYFHPTLSLCLRLSSSTSAGGVRVFENITSVYHVYYTVPQHYSWCQTYLVLHTSCEINKPCQRFMLLD